ncbi:MAG: ABC transporter permease subunit [Chitinophagaceae bacterium]|nr:ABC transporter permease subunit [Oligoflexus sp.]
MNKILILMRRELQSYFTTWLGYIVMAAALLLNGLLFNAFALGDAPKYSSDVLRDFFFFTSGIGMVSAMLLAMRLIAEEKQNKSLVLLFTAPISERQIVWGKFLAAFLMFFLLNILSLYLPALIFVEGKVSLGHIFAGYLGVTLLGAAVLAISLYASALAPTQLLAGVGAAAMTVVMLLLWLLSARSDAPFKDILAYVSIHNERFRPFTMGIIHTRDVIYYLSLTGFFVECAVRATEQRRARG